MRAIFLNGPWEGEIKDLPAPLNHVRLLHPRDQLDECSTYDVITTNDCRYELCPIQTLRHKNIYQYWVPEE